MTGAAVAGANPAAQPQGYPSRLVTVVVPWPAPDWPASGAGCYKRHAAVPLGRPEHVDVPEDAAPYDFTDRGPRMMSDTTLMHDRQGPISEDATETARQSGGSDSSLERMLGLLDLFSADRPTWTAEEICGHLSLSQATAYRYLRILSRIGLLAPAAGSAYSLGPRITQLDRQMRQTDPLLRHGLPVIERVRPELHGMFMLSRYYGDHVLCVHQDRTDPTLRTSMERGRPMELFRGAAPRVILAFLPTYQLRNLMLRHADRIRAAGLGASWDEFRKRLKAIRKEGYCVAVSEVDPGMVGIAAPVFRAAGAVIGGFSLALTEQQFAREGLPRLRNLAQRCADEISAALMRSVDAH